MNTRERFVKTLTGEKVDRVPFIKVFGETNSIHKHWEGEYPGIGERIDKLLGFEGTYRGWGTTPVNMGASKLDEEITLKEDGEIMLRQGGDGTLWQIYKSGDYNRHSVRWPIKTKEDWNAYKKKHLDPDDPARFPDNWNDLAPRVGTRDS